MMVVNFRKLLPLLPWMATAYCGFAWAKCYTVVGEGEGTKTKTIYQCRSSPSSFQGVIRDSLQLKFQGKSVTAEGDELCAPKAPACEDEKASDEIAAKHGWKSPSTARLAGQLPTIVQTNTAPVDTCGGRDALSQYACVLMLNAQVKAENRKEKLEAAAGNPERQKELRQTYRENDRREFERQQREQERRKNKEDMKEAITEGVATGIRDARVRGY